MPPIPVRTVCALVLLPLGGARAGAQTPIDTLTLTLAEARSRALRANPAFLAEAQALPAARGRLSQARAYPFNPEAELEAPGAAAGQNVYRAALTQQIEAPGRTRLRARAAGVGVERADAEVRDAARLALAAAGDAFYSALAAERRLAATEQILELSRTLLAAIRVQRREGEISTLQANLAEIEVGRARARVLAGRRELAAWLAELRRVAGLAQDRPIRLRDPGYTPAAPPAAHPDSLLAAALALRPDLAAGAAAVRQAETLAALARSDAMPTLRIAALAERDEVGGAARFGAGVGMSLPVLDRGRGNLAAARAEVARVAYARAATELRVRAEVAQAEQAYAAAAEEVAVYEADVLRPTRQNQTLLETAYRAGKIDLPSLLLVRNQLREAELGYWDAWLALRRARVRLDAATGAEVAP